MTRVDLHLHLLPGLDDGAPDEATALRHARRLVACGIAAATVTPHIGHPCFPVDPFGVRAATARLQRALDLAGIALRLRPGGEVHPGALRTLSDAELDEVAQGPRHARWILAEVPFAGIDEAFADAVAAVGARGFGVVIAHPERAAGVLTDGGLRRLRPLLDGGAVLQVNACSLMGRHGAEALEAARRLLRSRLAYVMASDGHPPRRHQTLRDGELAAARLGATAAQLVQLTQSNPRFLLEHGLPPVGAPAIQPGAPATAAAAARRIARSGRLVGREGSSPGTRGPRTPS